MKVAIIGSREFTNEQQVRDFVKSLPKDTVIYSGGAKGVDNWAADEALKLNGHLIEIMPNYSKWGPNVAPLKRNEQIIQQADRVVAFWTGVREGPHKSTGTIHAAKYAKKNLRPILVFAADGTLWPESEWTK